MIISAVNRDSAILANILDTLRQVRVGGTLPAPLTVDGTGDCTVSFYVDEDRTQLLFEQNSTDNPDQFTTSDGRTIYQPDDTLLNFSRTPVSTTFCQPLYYCTMAFAGGETISATYDNRQNLLFQSVIVSTQDNPPFSTNDNTIIVVPDQQQEENTQQSDDYRWIVVSYKLFVQRLVYDWTNLSEEQRLIEQQNTANVIRNALYLDRYRGGNAALKTNDLEGTFVSEVKALPSKDVLRFMLRVRCAFLATSTTY